MHIMKIQFFTTTRLQILMRSGIWPQSSFYESGTGESLCSLNLGIENIGRTFKYRRSKKVVICSKKSWSKIDAF